MRPPHVWDGSHTTAANSAKTKTDPPCHDAITEGSVVFGTMCTASSKALVTDTVIADAGTTSMSPVPDAVEDADDVVANAPVVVTYTSGKASRRAPTTL